MDLLTRLHQEPFILIQKRQEEIALDLSMLSEAELVRHNRFIDTKKRNEFLAGRNLIKTELGTLLNVAPNEIKLALSDNGKPFYKKEGEEQVHFNLSHGSGYFILALSLKPVGVDLERKREVSLDVMQPILSRSEALQLSDVPESEQSAQILKLFTAKEAFIKATDKKYGLDEIEFFLAEAEWALKAPKHKVSIEHVDYDDLIIAITVDQE